MLRKFFQGKLQARAEISIDREMAPDRRLARRRGMLQSRETAEGAGIQPVAVEDIRRNASVGSTRLPRMTQMFPFVSRRLTKPGDLAHLVHRVEGGDLV